MLFYTIELAFDALFLNQPAKCGININYCFHVCSSGLVYSSSKIPIVAQGYLYYFIALRKFLLKNSIPSVECI